jgi:microcystin-dependent protein
LDPYLGQIILTAFPFPPKGYALANGQLLPIKGNQALFAVYGTMFGGDGATTFGLPDLRGRTAIHADGASYSPGAHGGEVTHTLTPAELPPHTHPLLVNDAEGTATPTAGSRLAQSSGGPVYARANDLTAMAPISLSGTGGDPHENVAPSLVLSYCVALVGVYPSTEEE